MSTPAIFTFVNFEANNFKDIHFYIPQEGHPKSAAAYFEETVHFAELSEPSDPDLVTQFIYATGPDGHNVKPALQIYRLAAGDLEWGYTITEVKPYTINVTVHTIKNGAETQHWSGTLNQFLSTYL